MKKIILSCIWLCSLCACLTFAVGIAFAESPYLEIDKSDPSMSCVKTANIAINSSEVKNAFMGYCIDTESNKYFMLGLYGREAVKKFQKGLHKDFVDAPASCQLTLSNLEHHESVCQVSIKNKETMLFVIHLPGDMVKYTDHDIASVHIGGTKLEFSPSSVKLKTSAILDLLMGVMHAEMDEAKRTHMLSPYSVTWSDLLRYPLGGAQVASLGFWQGRAEDWARAVTTPSIDKAFSLVQRTMPDWSCGKDQDGDIECTHAKGYNVVINGYKISKAYLVEHHDPEGNHHYQYIYAISNEALKKYQDNTLRGTYLQTGLGSGLRELGFSLEREQGNDGSVILKGANADGYLEMHSKDNYVIIKYTPISTFGPEEKHAPTLPPPGPQPMPGHVPPHAGPHPGMHAIDIVPPFGTSAKGNTFDQNIPGDVLSKVCIEVMKGLKPYDCTPYSDPAQKQKCEDLIGLNKPGIWNDLFKSLHYCDGDQLAQTMHNTRDMMRAIDKFLQRHPIYTRYGFDAVYASRGYFGDMLNAQMHQCRYDHHRRAFLQNHPASTYISLDPSQPVTPQAIAQRQPHIISVLDWLELVYVSDVFASVAKGMFQTNIPQFNKSDDELNKMFTQLREIITHGRME